MSTGRTLMIIQGGERLDQQQDNYDQQESNGLGWWVKVHPEALMQIYKAQLSSYR
jgi:hypothetical protein